MDAVAPENAVSSILPLVRGDIANGGLHDEIYALLREAMIVGDIVPGQVFSSRTLAERFGTSLIPVRDALKRLVAEHALAMLPNRTLCVPRMTRERFQELLQVRLSLEPILAQRAVAFLDAGTIGELERIDAEMQDAVPRNDVKCYLFANHRFHFTLYGAARSIVAFPIVASLWMQVGPFLNGVFTLNGTRHAQDNHIEVLKALRRHDPVAVASAIASDLADAADIILTRNEFVLDGGTPAERGRQRKEG